MILTTFLLGIVLTFSHGVSTRKLPKELHPDTGLNILQMIERQGYPYERHSVETEDGYILEVHRIPHGKNDNLKEIRPAVLLMHGLVASSDCWVFMGPEISISYQLVDDGYDVWMGNARGNNWSRNHTTLNPDTDHEFWKFSFHEIGVYDLPATIDYISKTTGQESIYYIGHSQGTTSFFVMASERPEYNEKIRLMSAFAPAAYMSHLYSPLTRLQAVLMPYGETIAEDLQLGEVYAHTEDYDNTIRRYCNDSSPTQEICADVILSLFGFDNEELNYTMITVITGVVPAGASIYQYFHYGQEIISGKFRQYDYGEEGNIEKYGQLEPPDYDLSKITAPVALNFGSNDWMVGVEDVEQLSQELPNVVDKYLVPHEKFNHLDFLWAIHLNELLHNHVFALMKKF